MKITAIVDPPDPTAEFANKTAREFDAVDEFVHALGLAAGISIPVIEGTLADAPADGYVIVFDEGQLEKGPQTSRVLLVNADRGSVLAELEDHGLVGAIEKLRYFRWRRNRSEETGGGLFGRKELADSIGATLSPGPFQSSHYGLFSATRYTDLPSLVVGYLEADHLARRSTQ